MGQNTPFLSENALKNGKNEEKLKKIRLCKFT